MGLFLFREPLDLLIVGAGPAGIALGAEAVRSGADPARILVVEKGEPHTFSIRKYYPDGALPGRTDRNDSPAVCTGVPAALDPATGEVLSHLDRAIRDHQLVVRYRETVLGIRRGQDLFLVETDAGSYPARLCSIAIGAVGKPDRPTWPVPPAFHERVCHDVSFETQGREDILVVGGGDSAAEFAQYLVQQGHRVVLSYRGIAFRRMNDINRASTEAMERSGRLCILRGSNVSAVEAEGKKAWVLFSDQSAPPLLLDRIVLALGGRPPEGFLHRIGIDFDGRPAPREGYGTSVPGLFFVGDLTGQGDGPSHSTVSDAMRAVLNQAAPRARLKAS
jgi:thioredoxin reductase (NADPH)